MPGLAITNNSSSGNSSNSQKVSPKATHCIRHPEKKVKYFCESDVAFLCSKCVLMHTGAGHLIGECRLDLARIRSDFQDVKSKISSLIDNAEATKAALEQADRKLAAMCNKQQSKLEIAYKSIIKTLEQKKQEFMSIIQEFYRDQRQRVNSDKNRTLQFL